MPGWKLDFSLSPRYNPRMPIERIDLRNAEDFRKMDDIYRRHFAEGYPARTTVVTEFVSSGILIQIDAVAYKPG